MVNFIQYDIILLVLFVLFVSIFLYRNRSRLKKEGLLFLYKTSWGIKLIDKTAKRFPKTLRVLSYVSIGMGYLLMVGMLYLFARIVYLYVAFPEVVRAVKVPPVTPLIPYLPQVFRLDFLPPFYFIYWIVILAIIAISHEFFHGIFMRRYKIHIKSTGFGFFPFFLPVFLAAFVEQDEKSMTKASKFQQKAVLAAGTFANMITAALGFLVMILFFSLAFNSGGIVFDNYAYGVVGLGSITAINSIPIDDPTYSNLLDVANEEGFNEIETSEGKYFVTKDLLESQEDRGGEEIFAYTDSPAINSELSGIITEIDGTKIGSIEDLGYKLGEYSPGDQINIETLVENEVQNYEIVLGEHPEDSEKAWLGINFQENQRRGAFGRVITFLTSFRDSHVFYEPVFQSAEFIYNFLWWLVLISFSVALVNMLPMGIFDGGRFFYLTIWGLTKNEKKAKKWFSFTTSFLLFLLFVLMAFWALSFV